jgi:hypothetical protein
VLAAFTTHEGRSNANVRVLPEIDHNGMAERIVAQDTELATLRARCAQYEAVVGAAVTFVEVVDPPKTDNYREYRIASDALIAAVRALAAHLAGSIRALAATTPEGDTNHHTEEPR